MPKLEDERQRALTYVKTAGARGCFPVENLVRWHWLNGYCGRNLIKTRILVVFVCRSSGAFKRGGSSRRCPRWVDAVEKVLKEPLERNNRIQTASRLNRNCVWP